MKHWKKYTLEFLVIVFGILTAISLENWNEERKEKDLELELLGELKKNLQNDLSDIQNNINFHKTIHNSQTIISNWLDDDQHYHDSLKTHFGAINLYTIFISYRSTFETIQSIGIQLIKNDDLRGKVQKLYSKHYFLYKLNEEQYIDYIIDARKDINPTLFPRTKNIDLSKFDLIGSMKPHSVREIKASKEFKHFVKTGYELNDVFINFVMLDSEKHIKEVISMIDIELGIK